MTARDHNKILSILFFVGGGLQLLLALFFLLLYGGIGAAMITTSGKSDEQAAGGFMLGFGIVFGGIILLMAVFYLFTGWKILKQQRIGKILGIIASVLSLFSFPLGTALGVYGLWFFLGDQGKTIYDGQTGSFAPPPPPNSWQ